MTTVKTEIKRAAVEPEKKAWNQDDMRAVYEIHTLAQMLYGEIARTTPWATPVSPLANYQCPVVWPPAVASSAAPEWSAPTTW